MPRAHRRITGLSEQDIARFNAKYTMLWPGGCWEWEATADASNRGMFSIGRSMYGAPRIAYFLFTSEDPGELQVQHTCNNPACVCPIHLVLGTNQTNSDYKFKCGRFVAACGIRNGAHTSPQSVLRGEDAGNSKLTEIQVLEILTLRSTGLYSLSDLAEKFGVTKANVGYICRGDVWRHVYESFHAK